MVKVIENREIGELECSKAVKAAISHIAASGKMAKLEWFLATLYPDGISMEELESVLVGRYCDTVSLWLKDEGYDRIMDQIDNEAEAKLERYRVEAIGKYGPGCGPGAAHMQEGMEGRPLETLADYAKFWDDTVKRCMESLQRSGEIGLYGATVWVDCRGRRVSPYEYAKKKLLFGDPAPELVAGYYLATYGADALAAYQGDLKPSKYDSYKIGGILNLAAQGLLG